MRRLLIGTVLLVLYPACAHIRVNSTPTCPDRTSCSFEGLQDALATGSTLHLLVVHGMGPQEIGYSRQLVAALTKDLGLISAGGGGVRRIKNPADDGPEPIMAIRKYQDPSASRRMIVYEVIWAPVVDYLKEALDYDSQPEKLIGRAILNRGLKRNLINARLSDPVLYIGYRRQAMQFPVQYTLCQILGGGMTTAGCSFTAPRAFEDPNYPALSGHDKVAIVTMSLGSKLTFDALSTVLGAQATGTEARSRLAGKLTTFFMLANQLPLLELADRDDFASDEIPIAHLGKLLQTRDRSGPWSQPAFSVVAISDPNDLLSYDIPDTLAVLAPDIQFVNINVRLAHNYLGIIANPLAAHISHAESPRVIRYITRGSHN